MTGWTCGGSRTDWRSRAAHPKAGLSAQREARRLRGREKMGGGSLEVPGYKIRHGGQSTQSTEIIQGSADVMAYFTG